MRRATRLVERLELRAVDARIAAAAGYGNRSVTAKLSLPAIAAEIRRARARLRRLLGGEPEGAE